MWDWIILALTFYTVIIVPYNLAMNRSDILNTPNIIWDEMREKDIYKLVYVCGPNNVTINSLFKNESFYLLIKNQPIISVS